MSDGVEIRTPRGTAQIAGAGGAKIDAVTMQFSVNRFPIVNVGFHDATTNDAGVVKLGGSDVAERVAAQQNTMFEAASPNSSVTVEDGKGNTLTFSGYVSGPNYQLSIQNVGFSTSIAQAAAAVANFQPSIYSGAQGEFRDGEALMTPEIGPGLLAILDRMKENFENRPPPYPDKETEGIIQQIASNNDTGYDIWSSICNASTVEWPELENLMQIPSIKNSLQAHIVQIYRNSYADFFQTMMQFRAMFSMVYVPSLKAGEYGKFIPTLDMATSDAEDLEVNLQSITMSAGPKSIMPLSYVAVRGPKMQEHRNSLGGGQIISRWPDTAQSDGQVVQIGTPSWIPSDLTAGRLSEATVGDTLDLDSYESGSDLRDRKLIETINKDVGKVLKRSAQEHYVDFSLANSSANLVIDLDVSIQPGVRYKVTTEDSAIFTGFLVGVKHNVCSKPNQHQANTELAFSHVEAEGFELPNKT